MADRKKITRMPRLARAGWVNIGTILFGVIFLYMISGVFIYLSTKHEPSYEVTEGSISGNYRYTALARKDETVVTADDSGYVVYYARNGASVASDTTVCAIMDTLPTADGIITELDEETGRAFRNSSATFAMGFSDSSFQSVYNYKADLQSLLLQTADPESSIARGVVNYVTAPSEGFVVFGVDGMEGLELSQLTENMFSGNQYRVSNLRLENDKVKRGDVLFKMVTGETWDLCFPLSDSLKTRLQDRSTVRFRFLKDDTTFSAAFSIAENESGASFGVITLKNSLVRYVADRFLDIELLMDSRKGLKVPASAITEKVFYRIPEEYVITNPDNSGEVTFLRETYRNTGESSVGYVTTDVYARSEGGYLVDTSLLKEGDYIQMPDTSKKHKVTTKNLYTMQGVYNINQGYAQFRQVAVIDANEEFCIVEPYNPYGLAAHDFIALKADEVEEGQIIRP